jgi:hypothetical protein
MGTKKSYVNLGGGVVDGYYRSFWGVKKSVMVVE